MEELLADRIKDIPKSFIREILKVASDPEVISFAGGLPNPDFFPVQAIKEASVKVLEENGKSALQYSTTEGYLPLREYIADRYAQRGVDVTAEEILITNGSQQGLDLIAKIFLNQGDDIIIEEPGYLGAIQSLSMYDPQFHPVPLTREGVEIDVLEKVITNNNVKFFYAVPNFQNPSGITYSLENRKRIAQLVKANNILFVEDDPYGELRFIGKCLPSIKNYSPDNTILLGSFSKIVAPGFRLGWVCLSSDKREKLVIAKQAADLQSNYFAQRVIYRYLAENDVNKHIAKIKAVYKRQRQAMVEMIEEYFPEQINFTKPEGGMFLWVTLPEGISSMELFEAAIDEQVAFVPGSPFYVGEGGKNTLRLNYSNVDESRIREGIQRLAKAIKKLI